MPSDVQVYHRGRDALVLAACAVLLVTLGVTMIRAASLVMGVLLCTLGLVFAGSFLDMWTSRICVDETGIARNPRPLFRNAFAVAWSDLESFRAIYEDSIIKAIGLHVIGQRKALRIADAELSVPGPERFVQQLRDHSVREQ